MSTNRIIRLAQILSTKYADNFSFQEEVSAHDALDFLRPIANGPLEYGRDKAQQIVKYLDKKLQDPNYTVPFADASYVDSIIANMVYSKLPDSTVSVNALSLLEALKDQKLEETGSFKREFIPNAIARFKKALSQHNNDGAEASTWSAGGPERLHIWEEEERAKQLQRQQFLAQRNKQLPPNKS